MNEYAIVSVKVWDSDLRNALVERLSNGSSWSMGGVENDLNLFIITSVLRERQA